MFITALEWDAHQWLTADEGRTVSNVY